MSGLAPKPSVALISMPWAPLVEPSLGLGILSAKLRSRNIPVTVRHFNMFLLKYLKFTTYDVLSGEWALNDFLFSNNLNESPLTELQEATIKGWAKLTSERELGAYKPPKDPALFREYILKIRCEIVPRYLQECLESVLELDTSMVGFTCMFDQTVASLALAKEIKEVAPGKLVVFGGYALEPPVGPQILKCFPFVDAVVFGEGEERIEALAEASLQKELLADIPGIMYRDESGEVHRTPAVRSWMNLNHSPAPDYDDFFRDLQRLKQGHQVEITPEVLPVESSRGCWWGQVSHCIFCGIDDDTMRYRQKSPEAVMEMLDHLHQKHRISRFRFSDYILPRSYYKTLLPALKEKESQYRLHWEMKSNVNLADVQLMQAAGIRDIQPGIESFSTPVLKKMQKGVSGIQNVLTVKLLMEHDIGVHYNILYEFPEDEPQEYYDLVEKIPLLYHLMPPHTTEGIVTTRYSPIQQHPERYGGRAPLQPAKYYHLIFSEAFLKKTGFKLEDYCYIFQRPYSLKDECQMLYGILVFQVTHWSNLYQDRLVELSWENIPEGIAFCDSRYSKEPAYKIFGPEHGAVYRMISQHIATPGMVVRKLENRLPMERVIEILEELVDERLIFCDDGKYLGLALPVQYYEKQRVERMKNVVLEPAGQD